ncbi:hypothetical protein F4778DRAFT_543269 [Xylariomycetidae sp. FL2044]|nr:hypothetical protein F4778DRAFT_543269 [Xylariomycetidae sp. FL2044]
MRIMREVNCRKYEDELIRIKGGKRKKERKKRDWKNTSQPALHPATSMARSGVAPPDLPTATRQGALPPDTRPISATHYQPCSSYHMYSVPSAGRSCRPSSSQMHGAAPCISGFLVTGTSTPTAYRAFPRQVHWRNTGSLSPWIIADHRARAEPGLLVKPELPCVDSCFLVSAIIHYVPSARSSTARFGCSLPKSYGASETKPALTWNHIKYREFVYLRHAFEALEIF